MRFNVLLRAIITFAFLFSPVQVYAGDNDWTAQRVLGLDSGHVDIAPLINHTMSRFSDGRGPFEDSVRELAKVLNQGDSDCPKLHRTMLEHSSPETGSVNDGLLWPKNYQFDLYRISLYLLEHGLALNKAADPDHAVYVRAAIVLSDAMDVGYARLTTLKIVSTDGVAEAAGLSNQQMIELRKLDAHYKKLLDFTVSDDQINFLTGIDDFITKEKMITSESLSAILKDADKVLPKASQSVDLQLQLCYQMGVLRAMVAKTEPKLVPSVDTWLKRWQGSEQDPLVAKWVSVIQTFDQPIRKRSFIQSMNHFKRVDP